MVLTLWDSHREPTGRHGIVYRWNGHAEDPGVRSLFRFVEAHDERLRGKYTAWIHDLGESRIRGRRLVDHLVGSDGLSYWWMTPFVEQSPWKSPAILDALRLLAVEDILVREQPGKLLFVSANRNVHRVLRDLCRRLGVTYEWERVPAGVLRRGNIRSIYRSLPHPVRGLVSLVRCLGGRWAFRRSEKVEWFWGSRDLFVCSYFGPVDRAAAEQGTFCSGYWPGLQSLQNRLGRRSNWLQLFLPSTTAATPAAAMKWVRRFNQDKVAQGTHRFLDSYMSWRIVARVLARWCRLVWTSWRLRGIKDAFRPEGAAVSLWPVMRQNWFATMRGSDAISNLLWITLFDEAIRDLPYQTKGLYLYESQAWERALIHAWRKHGHGQLFAVQHSTVRFWDLRYFPDPRTLRSPGTHPMPRADRLVLNGPAATEACLRAGFPPEEILECEALRFDYLHDLPPRPLRTRDAASAIRVLVLGDYTAARTAELLRLLERAAPTLATPATYTLKPHPLHLVGAVAYPSLHLTVTSDLLETALPGYDVAYCGNLTAAAVDACLAGLQVIVSMDETQLNFSPLRGWPGVQFVSSSEELAQALETAGHGPAPPVDPRQFFLLDPDLPRWRFALESA